MAKQLSLNLPLDKIADPEKTPAKAKPEPGKTAESGIKQHRLICRVILRWLEETAEPTAMALNVPTRTVSYNADIAAFWSKPKANPHPEGPRQIMQPQNTMIVQCYGKREDCWPDCVKAAELLPHLEKLRAALAACEEKIRQAEPALRDNNTLFKEYASWRYEDSASPEYHKLKREIEKVEHSIYSGTRFDRIRAAHLADRLYLAVPEGLVTPAELANGWGLLWINKDLEVREVVSAEPLECIKDNRQHLVQNIAAAAKTDVLFRQGLVRHKNKNGLYLVKPPASRRKPEFS